MNHTPGPWIWTGIYVENTQGKVIAEALKVADGRLIAAAPELLYAIEAVIEWDGCEAWPHIVAALQTLVNRIKKGTP